MTHPFDRPLGFTIRIDRGFADILGNRDGFGHPIDGGSTAEDKLFDSHLFHCFQQGSRFTDIVLIIPQGLRNGFGDFNKCRKMYHGFDLVFLQCFNGEIQISEIALNKFGVLNRLAMSLAQIVQGD